MIHTNPNPISHGQNLDCPISAPGLAIHSMPMYSVLSPEYDASLFTSSFPGSASTNRFVSLCSPDGVTILIIYARVWRPRIKKSWGVFFFCGFYIKSDSWSVYSILGQSVDWLKQAREFILYVVFLVLSVRSTMCRCPRCVFWQTFYRNTDYCQCKLIIGLNLYTGTLYSAYATMSHEKDKRHANTIHHHIQFNFHHLPVRFTFLDKIRSKHTSNASRP